MTPRFSHTAHQAGAGAAYAAILKHKYLRYEEIFVSHINRCGVTIDIELQQESEISRR